MQQSIARAVARIYDHRRQQADIERDDRVAVVHQAHPRLAELDQAIAQAGAELLREAIEPGRPRHAAARKTELEAERMAYLSESGIDPEFDRPRYQCSRCQDTGRVGRERCQCYQQVMIPLLLSQANMRPLGQASFDQFNLDLFSDQPNPERYHSQLSPRRQIQGIRQASEQFVRSFNQPETRNLLFVGSPGTGKSYMMGCIGNALIRQGHAVFYTTAPQLFERLQERRVLRATFSPDPTRVEEAEAVYELLLGSSLLLIDDLGTETSAAGQYADLLTILDSRQQPGLRTIISSNAAPATLRREYDERILSRLLGQFALYHFFGEDLRLSAGRQRR